MSNILQNYNESFISNDKDVITCYKDLLNDYISTISENNIKTLNANHSKFIIKRGIDTITHCFKILLVYSKNIEIIKTNCKKAICYYVEFIGQIGEDSNSFLQLTSKDAALFVYKKIIFDIDQDFRRTFELTNSEKTFIKKINICIDIIKNITLNTFLFDEYEKDICENYKTYSSLKNKITTILNKILKFEFDINHLETIKYFVTNLIQLIKDEVNYINTVNSFIKKLNTKDMDIEHLQKKLFDNSIINEKQHTKFVNWLFVDC